MRDAHAPRASQPALAVGKARLMRLRRSPPVRRQLWQHVAARSVQCHQLLVRLPRVVRTARFRRPDSWHCLRGVVTRGENWGSARQAAYWGLSPSPLTQKSTQKQEQLAA